MKSRKSTLQILMRTTSRRCTMCIEKGGEFAN